MIEHTILSGHPQVVAHRARVAVLEAAQAAHHRRLAERRAQYDQAVREWRQARVEALRTGAEIPPEPVEPASAVDDVMTTVWELRELRQAETRLVIEIGDELVEAAMAAESDLLEIAAGRVAELGEIADQLNGLLGVVNRVDRARAVHNPSAPRTIDVRGLVASIVRGETTLRPERRTQTLVVPR